MIHGNDHHCTLLGRPHRRPAWTNLLPKRRLLLFVFAAWTVSSAVRADTMPRLPAGERNGQVCSTVLTPAQFEKELTRDLPFEALQAAGDTYPWYVPITVHIVRYSDGTGGIPLEDVALSLADTNQLFQQTDLRVFQLGSEVYIDDDEFAELDQVCYNSASCGGGGILLCSDDTDCPEDNECDFVRECVGGDDAGEPCANDCGCSGGGLCVGENDRLRLINNNPDTLDIYYVPQTAGFGGQSTFTSSAYEGILVENDNAINGSTTPHEVGHYFDLLHTHETNSGIECPDGSNCDEAGDLLCDTPADPELDASSVSDAPACLWDQLTCSSGSDQGLPCADDSDCDDGAQCTDDATGPPGCDGTPYNPLTDNLMSYSRGECRVSLTAMQVTKMPAVWLSDRQYLYNRTRYVNTDGGVGSGTPQDPDGSLADAVDDAEDGDHLFLDSQLFAETPITIAKPLSLKVWDPDDGAAVIGP